eukprot:624701-Alexandrium_andersonii.AAC.1
MGGSELGEALTLARHGRVYQRGTHLRGHGVNGAPAARRRRLRGPDATEPLIAHRGRGGRGSAARQRPGGWPCAAGAGTPPPRPPLGR